MRKNGGKDGRSDRAASLIFAATAGKRGRNRFLIATYSLRIG